jgi:hypothetical protein
MPLDVVTQMYNNAYDPEWSEPANDIFKDIYDFVKTGDTDHLLDALSDTNMFDDLETMLLEVAKHFEEGCAKYGENNWRKGIPAYCYIDSALRHYIKYCRGDKDERHDRAFVWNIMCCIWTCRNIPELNTYKKE